MFERNINNPGQVLFSPLSWNLTQDFNAENKHFAVDVVAPMDSPIKAVATTVIFANDSRNGLCNNIGARGRTIKCLQAQWIVKQGPRRCGEIGRGNRLGRKYGRVDHWTTSSL